MSLRNVESHDVSDLASWQDLGRNTPNGGCPGKAIPVLRAMMSEAKEVSGTLTRITSNLFGASGFAGTSQTGNNRMNASNPHPERKY
jgi:hypothetical protein